MYPCQIGIAEKTGDPANPDIGNDTLHGGANDDILIGNAGDDILIGDTGAESLA